MSLLVENMTYSQAIRTIREIVLDTNPVQCFKVSGQDFVFSKDDTDVVVDDVTKTITEIPKLYDLTAVLRDKAVVIEVLPDFVAIEYTKCLENFNHPSLTEAKTISRKNYFSTEIIEATIEDYFSYYCPYTGVPQSTATIFDGLDYFGRKKLVFWVAYYLVDRKRMNYASANEMIRQAGGGGTEDLKNTEKTITTRVGEVFTVVEKEADGAKGTEGFTSYWGDQYSYFTKLQLWIRDRFERQFKDFSLRDDAMISQTFTMTKSWEPDAWVNTLRLGQYATDILLPDIR